MTKKAIAVILTDTHLSEKTIDVNKSIYKQAIKVAQDLGLNEIEHAGDIFQSRKSQSQAVLQAFFDVLNNLLENNIKLNCIVGNHDKTVYSESSSFLDPFTHHPAMNLYPYCGGRPISNDIHLHYASFFSEDEYFKMVLENDDAGSFGEKNILLTHIGVQGAVMNNGILPESKVTTNLFKKYDSVLIGHYHDPQQLGKVEYIGASMQHNFGEGTRKGLTIVYDDLTTELIPLDFPQYLKYEVSVNDMTIQDVEDLKKEVKSTNDHIRVILKGTEEDLKSFNKQSLLEIGVSVQLEQEKIDVKELETRVEAFDSLTLTAEFETFCEENKLNKTEGRKYFKKIV